MPLATEDLDIGLRKTGEQNSWPNGKQAGYLTASMECSAERPMRYSQQFVGPF